MFKRRIVRYCGCGCGEKLVRKEKECMTHFLKRIYIDKAHAAKMAHRPSLTNICFCGKPRQNESPYCCWEHRLMAIKCKKWGIPPNVEAHDNHSKQLYTDQMKINDRFKSGITHSAYF